MQKPEESSNAPSNTHRWHFLLLLLIVGWILGSYIYLNRTPEEQSTVVTEGTITNLFPSTPPEANISGHTKFRIKSKYEKGEVVFIKFFRVQGVVIENGNEENYTILYRDRSGILQKIIIPKYMLLAPPDGIWNTFPIDN